MWNKLDSIKLASALLLLLVGGRWAVAAGRPVDFNRDIRPILAAKCFACHGPDDAHREAELRLDDVQAALDYGTIVPGKPTESELIRRIFADDADERMPPPNSDALTDRQQELIRRWVLDGAEYKPHWAFVPASKPALPAVRRATWPRNAIDYFVLARLEAEQLQPSPAADPYTLVRRLYLDLLGLPPTPAEADAFVHNQDPNAYVQLVDRLLRSPRYGERWAREWLDLARYADTNGYEKDRERSIWPYRDWVIRALNADLPFDQFTVEQLAGDMLPGLSEDRLVASGFHRNTMLNEEGGIDPLEYRFYAMVDRVATTGLIWLGLTTGCAQCHTHKYDPITHTDYYRFMALLNNADEPDLVVKTPDVIRRRRELQQRISMLEDRLAAQFPAAAGDGDLELRRRQNFDSSFQDWLARARAEAVRWTILRPTQLETNLPKLELLDDGSIFSTGDITKRDLFRLSFQIDSADLPITAFRLEALPDLRLPAGGPGRAYYEGRKGDFFLSEFTARIDGATIPFVSPSHSYGKISVGSGSAEASNVIDGDGSTGWSTALREGEPHQLVLNLAEPLTTGGVLQVELLFERHFAASLGRFRLAAASAKKQLVASGLPVQLESLLSEPRHLGQGDRARLKRHFARIAPELAEARKSIDELRKQMPNFPTTMVMRERPADNPRKTYRHHRGEFLSAREEVDPGIPVIFARSSARSPADRLELARWLVSDENPLVGRVTVNRAWRSFFGAGLVRTSGDFGTQADPPTHPLLLDWLASEFIDRGWSLKRLHRLIVTSATYRQSSQVTPGVRRRDPENQLLARGPRFRVGAETVRDMMLRASGLLSTKMNGPSVFPPTT